MASGRVEPGREPCHVSLVHMLYREITHHPSSISQSSVPQAEMSSLAQTRRPKEMLARTARITVAMSTSEPLGPEGAIKSVSVIQSELSLRLPMAEIAVCRLVAYRQKLLRGQPCTSGSCSEGDRVWGEAVKRLSVYEQKLFRVFMSALGRLLLPE